MSRLKSHIDVSTIRHKFHGPVVTRARGERLEERVLKERSVHALVLDRADHLEGLGQRKVDPFQVVDCWRVLHD